MRPLCWIGLHKWEGVPNARAIRCARCGIMKWVNGNPPAQEPHERGSRFLFEGAPMWRTEMTSIEITSEMLDQPVPNREPLLDDLARLRFAQDVNDIVADRWKDEEE